jgi:FMN-dependent NADH-azoreductase
MAFYMCFCAARELLVLLPTAILALLGSLDIVWASPPGIQPRVKIMRLLNIESSPRGSRSASIAVTNAFLEAYRQVCPGVMFDTLNVWEERLPDFDQEAIGAKYKGINKEPMDQTESAVWEKIQQLAHRFQQADRIVLGVPMWNFAYPYKLKQLIDLVSQRNMLFTYDGMEYGPLLIAPRAFVVYARGGTYAEDSPTAASGFDHQKGYIDFWLKFIGVKEVRTLVVEGTTWGGKEKGAETPRAVRKRQKSWRRISKGYRALIAPAHPQFQGGLTGGFIDTVC